MKNAIERVMQAIEDIRAGKMVVLVDDEDRENEGDLAMAAEKVTPDAINFMATYGRGLICLALDEAQIAKLKLPMMVSDNQATLGTAFTVSVEARHGVTTGISARDRATTILAAIADDARPEDLVSPGHIFPLKARRGGVLVRTGQTEGSVDLARLAGCKPSGVICEVMRDDGEMARMPDLERFAEEHELRIVSVADVIAYRLEHERIVERHDGGPMRPPVLGEGAPFDTYYYGTEVDDAEYLALVRGDPRSTEEPVLVRVQSLDPIGDPLGVRPELAASLRMIDQAGVGVFLYVFNKARTSLERSFHQFVRGGKRHSTQTLRSEDGIVRSDALRDFGLGAQVLADLGCRKVRLLSNSSRRIAGIEGFGIEVVAWVPIAPSSTNVVAANAAASAGANARDDAAASDGG